MRIVGFLFVFNLCIIFNFIGCGGGGSSNPFSRNDGTGVEGLDTPDEILSNPYVEDIIDEAEDEGLDITPEQGIDPPVISGTYDLNGTAYIPYHGPLAPGTWEWSNQTSDNHINTDYDQGFQTGSNVEGEIIRGTGNKFTVYSILNISQGGNEERGIIIVDGMQDNQGNVTAIYLASPVDDESPFTPSAGRL